ncbi:hypothetical protein I302_107183 [Kwoniella bestiolae CBS 10118]|uniref:Uncharacterized protein n=1 Tax=Kwoniella bestiolae CBS 10118 TaxID=1296100 RepID=A0A1B9FZA3_9TREE|nr:hypothetical protein I302_05552 [Kwoniella bestiolae CBS 10118]OCF24094.1 hypothetical protein I302_05552 [Kwoniella bestiolae CBS 10118]
MSDNPKTDIILSMARTATEDYMQQIVQHLKTHEFRKKLYPPSVKRIWFYETSPISAITHICEIDPTHVRYKDGPLEENGIGNREYNSKVDDEDWEGYDYAYRIKNCYKLRRPIGLVDMKMTYGINGAPRGMVYVTERMRGEVRVEEQICIWKED